jgi:hypothetical protein
VAHDYIVRRILKNRNFLTIGVRKVDVKKATAGDDDAENG